MERIYSALKYRLDHLDAFLIWYINDVDGFVLDDRQRALSFRNLSVLQEWVSMHGYVVETEEQGSLHDLDTTQQWSANPSPDTVDCIAVLNAWNLFLDIRASIEQRNVMRDDPENNDIYDKVFFGNNLSAITPPGEHYTPLWSEDEVMRLSRLLTEGLRLFRAHVIPVTAA
jgi:hypothetical protein